MGDGVDEPLNNITAVQRYRDNIGTERAQRQGRIHKFYQDFGLIRKRLAPQVSELEREFGSDHQVAFSVETLVSMLLEEQPEGIGDREAWRYNLYQRARSALRASDKPYAIPLALALRKLLAHESGTSWLDLRIGCDEIVRDAGVIVGVDPERAFADQLRMDHEICQMWVGRKNSFRLCSSLYTFGNTHRGGLGIFTTASERMAKRLYKTGIDIAREECEGQQCDLSWKMLLNAGLRHWVQLRASELRESDSDLEKDVNQMRNLAHDTIGTALVKLATEFAIGRYKIAQARRARFENRLDEYRGSLDQAEAALEAVEQLRPNSIVTPWMDLMCRVGRIELLLAQGHVQRAEYLMQQFYKVATRCESLYHVKFYQQWQQEYRIEPLREIPERHRFQFRPLMNYLFTEPMIIRRFLH